MTPRPVVTPLPDVDLSVVVPAYNEEQRLGPTIHALARFLSSRPQSWEIVVVDDGSTDGTLALCGAPRGALASAADDRRPPPTAARGTPCGSVCGPRTAP